MNEDQLLMMKQIESGNFTVTGIYTVMLDGGSVYFEIEIDGRKRSLIFDQRLSTETKSAFYTGGALGTDQAICLGKSQKLETALKEALNQKKYLEFPPDA